MEQPEMVPIPSASTAVALIARCLDMTDGGTPSDRLLPVVGEMEMREVIDLIAALAVIGAGLATAVSQVATALALMTGTSVDGLTPEEILARIHGATTVR